MGFLKILLTCAGFASAALAWPQRTVFAHGPSDIEFFLRFASSKAEVRRLLQELSSEASVTLGRRVAIECHPVLFLDPLGVSDCKATLESVRRAYHSGVLNPVSHDHILIHYDPSVKIAARIAIDARLTSAQILEWLHFLRQSAEAQARARPLARLDFGCEPGGQEVFPDGIASCWNILRSLDRALQRRLVRSDIVFRVLPPKHSASITYLNESTIEIQPTVERAAPAVIEQLLGTQRNYLGLLRNAPVSCEAQSLASCLETLERQNEFVRSAHAHFAQNTAVHFRADSLSQTYTSSAGLGTPLLILPLALEEIPRFSERFSLLLDARPNSPPCARDPIRCSNAELDFVRDLPNRMLTNRFYPEWLGPTAAQRGPAVHCLHPNRYLPPSAPTVVFASDSDLAQWNAQSPSEIADHLDSLTRELPVSNLCMPDSNLAHEYDRFRVPGILGPERHLIGVLSSQFRRHASAVPLPHRFNPAQPLNSRARIQHYRDLLSAPFSSKTPSAWRSLFVTLAHEALAFRRIQVPAGLGAAVRRAQNESPHAGLILTGKAHLRVFPHNQVWIETPTSPTSRIRLSRHELRALIHSAETFHRQVRTLNTELLSPYGAFESLRHPSASALAGLHGALATLTEDLLTHNSPRMDLLLLPFQVRPQTLLSWLDSQGQFRQDAFRFDTVRQGALSAIQRRDQTFLPN